MDQLLLAFGWFYLIVIIVAFTSGAIISIIFSKILKLSELIILLVSIYLFYLLLQVVVEVQRYRYLCERTPDCVLDLSGILSLNPLTILLLLAICGAIAARKLIEKKK